MPGEENKAVLRQFSEEVWNKGNLAAIDQLVANEFTEHTPMPGFPPNREGYKQVVKAFRSAFPDMQVRLEDVLAEGDKVVGRWTLRGTHRGDLLGTPPSGKQVTVSGMDVVRTSGGKIVEHWGQHDNLGLLQQIGVVPTMGQGQRAFART